MRILSETVAIGNSVSVLSRMGLRSITETLINLAYLLNIDNDEQWRLWRKYGSGQAKLVDMKFDTLELPDYVDIDNIRQIASEDTSSEFNDVNLGDWSGKDLRKRSLEAGVKDEYDKYYPWNSAYTHGAWGAIREACYNLCVNPLHRFHLVPSRRALSDGLSSAATAVDVVLELVGKTYPGFDERFSSK